MVKHLAPRERQPRGSRAEGRAARGLRQRWRRREGRNGGEGIRGGGGGGWGIAHRGGRAAGAGRATLCIYHNAAASTAPRRRAAPASPGHLPARPPEGLRRGAAGRGRPGERGWSRAAGRAAPAAAPGGRRRRREGAEEPGARRAVGCRGGRPGGPGAAPLCLGPVPPPPWGAEPAVCPPAPHQLFLCRDKTDLIAKGLSRGEAIRSVTRQLNCMERHGWDRCSESTARGTAVSAGGLALPAKWDTRWKRLQA